MKLSLYDNNLNRVAYIGEQFVSCLWSEGYNTVQNFTLELNATEEYKKKVRPDYYVSRGDRENLMVIKTVQIKDGKIIASGKQATRILDDIAFVGTIKAGQKIDTAIKSAYNKTNKYDKLSVEDGSIEVIYNHQISNKSMLEICLDMCQSEDVGFKISNVGGALVTSFYQPPKDANLILSEKFGNLSIAGITISDENLKNYAIVLGAGEGESRSRVIVDLSGGGKKYEMIVDANDLQKEEGETDDEYTEKLFARGIEKLLEKQDSFSCEFIPYATDFGTRYDLGDILTIYLNEYNLKLEARVAAFTQKSQGNYTETTVQVGQITIKR